MNILELSEQEIGRRQSLQQLRDMGINPYPAAEYPVTNWSEDIKANFHDDEKLDGTIAGRMMSRRVMGKASFIELQDSKGRIQVYITRDDICPEENKDLYNVVFKKLLDIGDIIGIKGFVFKTQTGEISVHAKEIKPNFKPKIIMQSIVRNSNSRRYFTFIFFICAVIAKFIIYT